MTVVSNVFGHYRRWVEKGLEELCPYGRETLKEKSGKIVFLSVTAAVLSMIFVLLINGPGFFTWLLMGFVTYIMTREIPGIILRNMRNRLYMKLPGYLSGVRKKFLNLGNIPEAVKEASREMPEEIRLNAEEIHDILLLGERRKAVREYVGKGVRNRFLKLFLIQAFEASEFGDGKGEKEGSVFAENLNLLRNGVAGELYSSRKTAYMFSGYMTVAVVPVLFYGVFKKAGLAFTDNMTGFYEGYGKAVLLGALILSFFVYRMVSDAGSDPGRAEKFFTGTRPERLSGKLENNKGIICRLIRMLISETDTEDTVAETVMKMAAAFSFPVISGIIMGVESCPGGLVILGVMGVLALLMPLLELIFKKARYKNLTVEEIKRMQMVIMMERKLESITVTDLLSDLELFARAFGNEIRETLNILPGGAEKALRNLKEKGKKKNEYFESIADGFLAVDEVGIEDAFADTISDRENMEKMEELENTIRTEKRKDLTDIIAWIPGAVMLGGYFVIPFLKMTLGEMEELFNILKGI